MLSGLLSRLGLVRRVAYQKAAEDLKKTQSRCDKFRADSDALRVQLQAARERAGQTASALKRAQQDLRERDERAARSKADLERKRKEMAEKFERDQQRRLEIERKQQTELEGLQQRLATAEQDLAIARENLMAVEVKLDILEGAANVLDARVRAVLSDEKVETTTSA